MFFNKKNKNKRGTTLVELTIVLALVAIIAVMTLTFTILVQKRVHLNTERDQLMMDLANIETLTKKWIVHYDNQDYKLWLYEPDETKWAAMGITDNQGKIYAEYNLASDSSATRTTTLAVQPVLEENTLYTLQLTENGYDAQWFSLGDSIEDPVTHELIREKKVDTRTYFSKYISRVEFAVLSSDQIGQRTNKRRVVKMRVWYTEPQTEEELSIDFMFTTHAQATIEIYNED